MPPSIAALVKQLLTVTLVSGVIASGQAAVGQEVTDSQPDSFDALLERLKNENAGEYEKVRQLPRDVAWRFLRERFAGKSDKKGDKDKTGESKAESANKRTEFIAPPARREQFDKIATLEVGQFAVDLCSRADGAFGLGEVRVRRSTGTLPGDATGRIDWLPLRRADFLITWQVDGRIPVFDTRQGSVRRSAQRPS